ncbi:MAG TPA: hypothetical protein VK934_12190 [Fimbriimonas sp.]|nr:hypothetical protein [Fimbriimonas sp.]
MRNGFGKVFVGLLALSALGGCRSKGLESFNSATTPVPPLGGAKWGGDPYTAGGIAEASGGTIAATNYGKGARPNTAANVDPVYDQPAKGSGSQPGEFTGEARGGFGRSNGPGLQASPSDVNSLSGRAGQ